MDPARHQGNRTRIENRPLFAESVTGLTRDRHKWLRNSTKREEKLSFDQVRFRWKETRFCPAEVRLFSEEMHLLLEEITFFREEADSFRRQAIF